jgi:hypothetical protein
VAKYRVTAPFAYARRTGEPSHGLGIPREIIRHDVGDIVELDDVVAAKFPRKLEWYVEPPKAEKRRTPKVNKTTPKNITYGGYVDISRDDVDFTKPTVLEKLGSDLAEQDESGDE